MSRVAASDEARQAEQAMYQELDFYLARQAM
jgi:hypothetical protein